LLQPEIIVLGVAVVAEATVLGGVLTGLVRLRARLGSLASDRPDLSQHTLDNPVGAAGHVAGNDGVAALVNDPGRPWRGLTPLWGRPSCWVKLSSRSSMSV